jgi:hypothetical protein
LTAVPIAIRFKYVTFRLGAKIDTCGLTDPVAGPKGFETQIVKGNLQK